MRERGTPFSIDGGRNRHRVGRLAAAVCAVAALSLLGAHASAAPEPAATAAPGDLTQLSLEELLQIQIPEVVAASRYTQKTVDAPASVSIVIAEEIRRHGYRTLGDILNGLPGFYTSYDRNYTYLGTRGFSRPGDYNTRVLLLLDGHRLNDDVFEQALLGTEGILDVELIDRVEVVRGPSSSVYGTNAFFGVINVITRRGKDLGGFEAEGKGASFGTTAGRLAFGRSTLSGLDVIASASGHESDGQDLYFKEFDTAGTNHGVAAGGDYDRYRRAFARVSRGSLDLEAAYSSREKGIPTGAFGTAFDDRRNRTTDERAFLEARYGAPTGARSEFSARLYHDWYRYYGLYAYHDPVPVLNDDSAKGYSWGTEIDWSTRTLRSHVLTTGIEYRDDYRQEQDNHDVDPYVEYLRSRRSAGFFALFAQDEFTPTKRFIVNLGLRHDRYETFGGTTNPRVALVYKPRERTALKLLFGRAFRAPNAYESFYSVSPSAANPDLSPETITTYEAVIESDLPCRVRLSASAFKYRTRDLITLELDPGLGETIYRNVESVSSHGAELALDRRWSRGVETRLSYSLQKTTNDEDNSGLTNSPRHLAKLHLLVPLGAPRLLGGFEALFTSRRKTLAGGQAGGFLVVNADLLARELTRGLDVSVVAYNLLDRHYGVPGSAEHVQDVILQDGRSARLSLTWRF
ncbi:MAG: TonB-dependent receptor [Acidobacteriia bacterium]|nr:TonB-dependent receptor [Terriglobia bacterium]